MAKSDGLSPVLRGKSRQISEFDASLACLVNSRPARAAW